MREIVARFQRYVRTYDRQSSYATYTDRTYIEDMLYGIGLSIDPEVYRGASGFHRFKELLREGFIPTQVQVQHSGKRAESATDIQLNGCRLHKRRDCKVC